MASLSDAERDAFLSAPRYAILIHHNADVHPIAVPVWYDWDGEKVSMFTHVSTPKMRNLKADPRSSVLVTNFPQEEETWVRFEGEVTFGPGGLEMAERVLDRYWPQGDPRRPIFESWKAAPDDWPMMELVPQRIVTHRE
jgi:nitroimidazol reductase NimA-like FMN-containing flavoprotein (pyridoxamine 5'-phosphate oxidase superfamily)